MKKAHRLRNTSSKLKLYSLGDVDPHINEVCSLITPSNKIAALTFLKKLLLLTQQSGYCSLSANQLRTSSFAMFVCLNKRSLVPQKWNQYKASVQDYECILNPDLVETSTYEEYKYEQCPSIQGYQMQVKRPTYARFRWKDEHWNDQEAVLKGFQLRLWLHQFDHLRGNLIIQNEICNGEIDLTEEAKTLDNQQALLSLREYYKSLRETPKTSKQEIQT